MIPVNDPALIAQLEGNTAMQPVTDPALIAQLEGNAPIAALSVNKSTSPIDRFLPAPQPWAQNLDQGLQNFFMGIGRGAIETPQNIKNIALSGLTNNYSGLGLPNMIANALASKNQQNQFGNVLAQIQNVTDKPFNAIKPISSDTPSGTLGELAGSMIPFAPAGAVNAGTATEGLISKGIQSIQPKKLAQSIMDSLSSGKNLEENSQSLAQDIQNAFKTRKVEGNALYKPVFDAAANNNIYQDMNPAMSAYQSLDKDVFNSYDRKLNKLHQNFIINPTLQNAHELQSQLGSASRQLQTAVSKGNADISTRNALQSYQEAQTALRNDMNNFLMVKDPDLANQYQQATSNWLQNVVPYTDNPKLAQIASGDVTNPKNITNLFKNPEPEIQKIVEDLSPAAKNKILYSQIGKLNPNLTADKLAQKLDPAALDTQGLGSYLSPDLQSQLEILKSRINNRNLFQRATGAGTAFLGLSHLGVNPELAGSAATAAGIYTPKVMNAISSRMNMDALTNALKNISSRMSVPARNLALATTINATQNSTQ